MAEAGRAEETVDAVKLVEIRLAVIAVARSHLAIVGDHAAGKDQMIVAADEGDHPAAVLLKGITGPGGVAPDGSISRTVLRQLRITGLESRGPAEELYVL